MHVTWYLTIALQLFFQGERVQKQTNSCDCGLFAPASVKKIFVMALTQQPSDMTKNYM